MKGRSLLRTARSVGRRTAPLRALHRWWSLRRWELLGRPLPPPSYRKRDVIADYAARLRCTAFVETGTYLGDTVAFMHRRTPKVYSIELDGELARRAAKRFGRLTGVKIIQGDSAVELPRLRKELQAERCLFWLDGHFSGGTTALGSEETPITRELDFVLPLHSCAAVLIDDAREFGRNPEYPTLDAIRSSARHHGYSFDVDEDIVRLVSFAQG